MSGARFDPPIVEDMARNEIMHRDLLNDLLESSDSEPLVDVLLEHFKFELSRLHILDPLRVTTWDLYEMIIAPASALRCSPLASWADTQSSVNIQLRFNSRTD